MENGTVCMLWGITPSNEVRLVEAIYRNNDMFWCPDLGGLVSKSYHIFDTKKEALKVLVKNLKQEQNAAHARVFELRSIIYRLEDELELVS
jgi:hypothetical protein